MHITERFTREELYRMAQQAVWSRRLVKLLRPHFGVEEDWQIEEQLSRFRQRVQITLDVYPEEVDEALTYMLSNNTTWFPC